MNIKDTHVTCVVLCGHCDENRPRRGHKRLGNLKENVLIRDYPVRSNLTVDDL